MGGELRAMWPEYVKLQVDLEPLRKLSKVMHSSSYPQLLQALPLIREQHLQMARLFEKTGFAQFRSTLSGVLQANQHWQNMISQAAGSVRFLEDTRRVHRTWLETARTMQNTVGWLNAAAAKTLVDVVYRLTVAERFFGRIDLEILEQSLALPKQGLSGLSESINAAASTYAKLAGSVETVEDIAGLPEFVLPAATREILTTGYALDTVVVTEEPQEETDTSLAELIGEVEEETSGWESLLQAVDPDLVMPYKGAHQALSGSNPDKARHVLVSLRELWDHLLRRLAPDHKVLTWVPHKTDLVHNGRPTRKARVLYICRSIAHGPLSDFTVEDTKAFVKLLNFFNRVHELRGKLTDQELRALVIRSDSWLMYVLRLWEGTR